ncbi:MAG: hypothetical protein ACTHNK_04090 [Thermomicrobiales bacterium]
MSTAFDLRDQSGLVARQPARPARTSATPAARQRPARAASRAAARGRAGRPGGAGLFGLATLALSALGLIYLIQISHVARSGYAISDLQRQQKQVEQENQLLQYQLDNERTIARAAEIARRDYGMQPYVGAALPEARDPGVTVPAQAAGAPAVATPGKRFITVQHPPAEAPVVTPTPAPPDFWARLWQRLLGRGAASAPAR